MKLKLRIFIGILAVLTIAFSILHNNSYQTNDDHMDKFLQELETKIAQREVLNAKVSQVPVAWHLDHILKSINGIYAEMEASNPDDYQYKFNINRLVIFLTGIMPRGKGKAPDASKPPEIIETEDLYTQLAMAKQNLAKVDALSENSHYIHYIFGTLNRQKSKRLIEIHTHHHLKIVRDILGE